MKLRIKGNDIRYRLTRTDVDTFAAEGYLEETINFAGKPLYYVLQETTGTEFWATYVNNIITLHMPARLKKEWATTEKVGYSATDGELSLLVEKDFKCLDNVAEDQSDNYPNPLAKK